MLSHVLSETEDVPKALRVRHIDGVRARADGTVEVRYNVALHGPGVDTHAANAASDVSAGKQNGLGLETAGARRRVLQPN